MKNYITLTGCLLAIMCFSVGLFYLSLDAPNNVSPKTFSEEKYPNNSQLNQSEIADLSKVDSLNRLKKFRP